MRKYLKVFDIGLQNTFVYRWNFLLRSAFGLVPLAGTVLIWRAIFQARGSDVAGYSYRSMVWYFLLTMLVDNLITPTEDEWQIAADIRDGQMNAFLVKPMNYLGYRFCLYGSYRLLYTAVTIVPIAGCSGSSAGSPCCPRRLSPGCSPAFRWAWRRSSSFSSPTRWPCWPSGSWRSRPSSSSSTRLSIS